MKPAIDLVASYCDVFSIQNTACTGSAGISRMKACAAKTIKAVKHKDGAITYMCKKHYEEYCLANGK